MQRFMHFVVFSEEETPLVSLDLAVLFLFSYSIFYKLPFSSACTNAGLLLFVVSFFLLPKIKEINKIRK